MLQLQQHDLRRIFHNLQVIPSNFQIRGMHTIIRDRTTSCADFVFYADRLLRLVVEAGAMRIQLHPADAEDDNLQYVPVCPPRSCMFATISTFPSTNFGQPMQRHNGRVHPHIAGLGHLPFKERTVETPTGRQYVGVDFAKKLCGVSIIRSGESMENALRACCKGIKIGKILVHRYACCLLLFCVCMQTSEPDISTSGGLGVGFEVGRDDHLAETSNISGVSRMS